jgi:transposase
MTKEFLFSLANFDIEELKEILEENFYQKLSHKIIEY